MNIHTVCAELFLADGQTDVAFRNFCERAHKLWWFNHPITSFLKINNAIMASMLLPLVTENVLELCMYVYIYVHTCVCVCVLSLGRISTSYVRKACNQEADVLSLRNVYFD